MNYKYKAYVINVHDGDTCRVDINLGLGVVLKNQTLRFFGIDAYELKEEKGKEARDFLKDLILEKNITIKTEKDKKGKYGRLLATLFLDDININELMVEKGYAVHKKY